MNRPATEKETDAYVPAGRPYTFEQGRVYALGAQKPWYVPAGMLMRWAARNGFAGLELYGRTDPRVPVRIQTPHPYNTVAVFRRAAPTASFGLPSQVVWVLPKPTEPPAPTFRVERRKS